jgi:hypothetical protein
MSKLTWQKATFGLTDMRWFYREDQAPRIFRLVGALFLFLGIAFLSGVLLSFAGPGSLYAMREASNYLQQTYGSAGQQSLSATKEIDDATIVRITYRHGDRSGELKARWNGKHYVFTERE